MSNNAEVTLALDSSSTPMLLALSDGKKRYSLKHSGVKQEEYLFGMIKKLFSKAGLNLKDTKRFFCIKGPGRFTGIRIGITLASMLSEINGSQIMSASVFEILKYQAENSKEYQAWHKTNPEGKLAVVLHAFREEYFTSIEGKHTWTSFEAALDILADQKSPLFIIGWGKDRAVLSVGLPKKYTYGSSKLNAISAASMLAMAVAQKELQSKEEVLTPLYLKPARFELNCK